MVSVRKYIRDVFLSCAVTILTLLIVHKVFVLNETQSIHSNVVSNIKDRPMLDQQDAKVANRGEKTSKLSLSSLSPELPSEHISIALPTKSLQIKTEHVDNYNKIYDSSKKNNTYLDFESLLNGFNICPKSVNKAYASQSKADSIDLDWCESTRNKYSVVVGLSWGSLPPPLRKEFDIRNCNDLLKLGKLQTCDEKYGWSFNKDWFRHTETIVSGKSSVKCATNLKQTIYCQSKDVVVDFSKAKPRGMIRDFSTGFLQTFGSRSKGQGSLPHIPGLQHLNDEEMTCDEVEVRPTFVLSNDDDGNLGHYINDVMMVWNMVVMANRSPNNSVLLNIDGIRAGGPAGGPAHRLMDPSNPDRLGPYSHYFRSWFQELRRGIEYKNKRVCFKEIYFQPLPGVPWFWNDWGIVNKCSTEAPSPQYQSFNLFLRHYWQQMYGAASLPHPDIDKVHIVIEVRSINPKKTNNHSSARYIRNLQDLIDALSSIPGVRVTALDFAKLSFEKQVSVSHSAGVFMSMHGAGTTHIFHAAIGHPNCCALVELFPDETIEFHTAHGYGNLARMLGFSTYRYVPPKGSTSSSGTIVEVKKIRELTVKAVNDVRQKATCLHDIKDTTKPIYARDGFEK